MKNIERLSSKLLNILNEHSVCFTPDEMMVVQKAVKCFIDYEDTDVTPDEVLDLLSVRDISPEAEFAINKHACNIIDQLDAILHQDDSELEAYRGIGDLSHLRDLVQAEKEGRLMILPQNCK